MSFSGEHSLDGSFPPSPTEDRGSKRLSWSNLLQKLTDLKSFNQGLSTQQCNSETGSVLDMSLSGSESSFFCYPPEETLSADVVATIAQSLQQASHLLGCSALVVPDSLLDLLGQELVRLAVSEPCGLKGALIDVCVARGEPGDPCTVDQIAVDAGLVPTFHVTLVLRAESGGLWPKVRGFFKGGETYGTPARRSLRLSPSFRAMKKKLYCSGELLIEECC
ncbi:DNA damage-inducible transcript 4 protein-like [Nerophis lumbriciformis]|uniref:DNA damage-inducible transcript 4 protein-like n=1 Tax=Nerophis lumbriciformis TaxID=546530 RepID=UPI002ADF6677|nr:DNA damage-inducible transcript 4 protein-like [Nerophis lumbriciformis]